MVRESGRGPARRRRRLMRRAGRRQRLARFWYADGDLDEAVKHAAHALRLARACVPAPALFSAEIHLTLARIERDRADYAAGHEHLIGAVGLLEALPPSVERDRLLTHVLVELADAHRRAGRYAALDATLSKARQVLEAGESVPHGVAGAASVVESAAVEALTVRALTVQALTVEGIAAKERGAYDRAAGCYAEVARLLGGSAASNAEIAALQHNLAGLAYARGRYAEAESHARRAVALRRGRQRGTAVDLAQDLAVLASALAGQHRYDEALALFDEALTICRNARPPRHYEVAVHLHNIAAIHQARGEHARAEQMYREALTIKEALLGGEHPEVGLVLNNLGTLLDDQGRHAEATACYRRALAIVEHAYPPGHPITSGVRHALAGRCRFTRRPPRPAG